MAITLTLLGTGSPPPDLERSQPAQLVEIDGERFLVDCGDGTRRRMLEAGIEPASIRRVILTHLHADHTLGFGGFVFAGWLRGRTELEVYGPQGVRAFIEQIFHGLYGEEIAKKIRNGRPAEGVRDFRIGEIDAGWELKERGLTISALPVPHSITTYALRFVDADGKVLVLSSDTAFHPPLAEFARGADVLVHEAYVTKNSYESRLAGLSENLRRAHSTPAEAGRIAAMAGVGQLVLTHFPPEADLDFVLSECCKEYSGNVVIGQDLMQITC